MGIAYKYPANGSGIFISHWYIEHTRLKPSPLIIMPPKKSNKAASKSSPSTRGRTTRSRSRVQLAQRPSNPPQSPPSSPIPDPRPSPTSLDPPSPPLDISQGSSVGSAASTTSSAPRTTKRARKTACFLPVEDEEMMLEFLRENPSIWNCKLMDYRRSDKKGKMWDDQATLMGKTCT